MKPGILVNLKRCDGCWTCSLACKVAHELDVEEFWLYVKTIGGGGIDEPGGTWPDLHMSWKPTYTTNCAFCAGEKSTEYEPYCVFNCPTKALTYGDLDDPESPLNKRKAELQAKGYRVFVNDEWEGTRDAVVYIDK